MSFKKHFSKLITASLFSLIATSANAACYLTVGVDNTSPLSDSDRLSIFFAANAGRDITTCDVSQMTTLEQVFYGISSFNQDVSGWDVRNVQNFSYAFARTSFNQDISGWRTDSATNISYMFWQSPFNQNVDTKTVGGTVRWDVSNVTNIMRAFSDSSFNHSLNNWDVASVTMMNGTFSDNTVFNSDISSWDVTSVTDMGYMFYGATSFNSDITGWAPDSSLSYMANIFDGASAFDQNLGSWDIRNVFNMTNIFNNTALSTANYDSILNGWNQLPSLRNSVTTFNAGTTKYSPAGVLARSNIISTYNWTITDGGCTVNPCTDGTDPTLSSSTPADGATGVAIDANIVLTFDEAVDAETGNIVIKKTSDNSVVETIAITSGQVTGSGTTTITVNPSNLMVSNTGYYVTIDATAFDDSWSNSYAGISSATTLNFTTVTNSCVLGGASMSTQLTNSNKAALITSATNGDDITGCDVSGITDFSNMFKNLTSFNQNISGWTTTAATNMSGMFEGATSFNKSLANWNVASVTNMTDMLKGTAITVANYDAILNGWSQISLQSNVTFGAGTLQYSSASVSARNTLANTYSWTINDGGQDLVDPKTKTDVMASIEAWTNITQRSSDFNIRSVNERLDFLRRNQGSNQLSHQGIKFNFTDENIDYLMNGNSIVPKDIDAALERLAMSGSEDKTQGAEQLATNTAKGILLAATEGFVPNLNPTGGEVYGEWSGWTAGEVTVGDIDATSTASKQKVKANHISIGMDKPISEQERIGFAFSIADDDVNIGTAGSFVNSNNYGVSTYGSFIYPSMTVQGLVGYGSLNFDTKRIDGAQTLTGTRKGDQIFTSVTMRSNTPTENGVFLIAPYGRLDASYTQLKKFAETGGSFALTHNKQNVTSTSLAAGLDITSNRSFRNSMFKPYAKIEVASDMSSGSDATMFYSSTASTVFSTTVNSTNDTSWRFEIGSDIFFVSGASGTVYYAKGGAGGSEDSDSFGLRISWSN